MKGELNQNPTLDVCLGEQRSHPRSFVGVSQKSILRDLVNFWRQMPTKWLQDRTNGSKTAPGIPPHRAFCGDGFVPSSREMNVQSPRFAQSRLTQVAPEGPYGAEEWILRAPEGVRLYCWLYSRGLGFISVFTEES